MIAEELRNKTAGVLLSGDFDAGLRVPLIIVSKDAEARMAKTGEPDQGIVVETAGSFCEVYIPWPLAERIAKVIANQAVLA